MIHSQSVTVTDRTIGEGRTALVYGGTYGSRIVAVKRLKWYSSDCQREAELLKNLRHGNIIKCFGYDRNEMETIDIFLELCRGGSLAKALHRKKLKNDWKYSTILQLSSGLAYLHQEGILHLDLKPPNVLFRDGKLERLVIADFGMAQCAYEAYDAGALKFQAPDFPFTRKSDIFSLASIACCILRGRNPETPEETKAIVCEVLQNSKYFRNNLWLGVLKRGVDSNFAMRPSALDFRKAFEQSQSLQEEGLEPECTGAHMRDDKDWSYTDSGEYPDDINPCPDSTDNEENYDEVDAVRSPNRKFNRTSWPDRVKIAAIAIARTTASIVAKFLRCA